jgi:hypothetical protein
MHNIEKQSHFDKASGATLGSNILQCWNNLRIVEHPGVFRDISWVLEHRGVQTGSKRLLSCSSAHTRAAPGGVNFRAKPKTVPNEGDRCAWICANIFGLSIQCNPLVIDAVGELNWVIIPRIFRVIEWYSVYTW